MDQTRNATWAEVDATPEHEVPIMELYDQQARLSNGWRPRPGAMHYRIYFWLISLARPSDRPCGAEQK